MSRQRWSKANSELVGPAVRRWQLDTTGPLLGCVWPQVVWHVRGAEADEHTYERMRGGGSGGGDVATIRCTILRPDEKGKIIKYLTAC